MTEDIVSRAKDVIRRVQEEEVVINPSVSVGMFSWQLRSAFSRSWEINKLCEKVVSVELRGKTMQSYAWFAEIAKL